MVGQHCVQVKDAAQLTTRLTDEERKRRDAEAELKDVLAQMATNLRNGQPQREVTAQLEIDLAQAKMDLRRVNESLEVAQAERRQLQVCLPCLCACRLHWT